MRPCPSGTRLAAKSLELRNLMTQPSANAAMISAKQAGDLRPAAENAGKIPGLSDERPEHPDAAAALGASSRMRPGVCGGYRLWRRIRWRLWSRARHGPRSRVRENLVMNHPGRGTPPPVVRRENEKNNIHHGWLPCLIFRFCRVCPTG